MDREVATDRGPGSDVAGERVERELGFHGERRRDRFAKRERDGAEALFHDRPFRRPGGAYRLGAS
jgi:hypothetical protein